MSVNLEYYRTFYYVAALGSMGKAAEAMQLTPPTITKTIQALERQLNCQLFARTSKGVRLTSAGEILYARVKPGLFLLDSGEQEVNQFNALEGGSVRIGVSESAVFSSIVSRSIDTFCSRYPKVNLAFKHQSSKEMTAAIQTGDIDLALFSMSSESDMAGLNLHEIATSDNVPVVGTRYRSYAGHPLSLAELTQLPLIFTEFGFSIRAHYEALYKTHGFDFLPTLEMPTLDMQIRAVKQGLGYSFVPLDLIREDLELDSLFIVDLKEEPVFPRTACLLTDKDIPLSCAAQMFIDILLDTAQLPVNEPYKKFFE